MLYNYSQSLGFLKEELTMYVLHIANKNYSSWSLRPWVLLHELMIPFVEVFHPFSLNTEADFLKFSPSGQMPCLQDEDLVIWDSLAITEYMAERHTSVWPNAKAARAWARSASAEMHSGFYALRQQCPMNTGVRIRLHDHMAALQADLQRLEALWQEGLQRFGGPFLAGATFTAVDAFFAPVALRVQTYGLNLSPDAQAYCQRLLQLASMQQWQTEALQETCRDDEQEQDIPVIGALLADYRHPQ